MLRNVERYYYSKHAIKSEWKEVDADTQAVGVVLMQDAGAETGWEGSHQGVLGDTKVCMDFGSPAWEIVSWLREFQKARGFRSIGLARFEGS
jgi:hypothetical protein